ncbi:MAG: anthranilate phosphoribosyltransferase, partial [Bacillota bacterium]|nr:anthranilate phosphoribosyltransferase [Bacillota bacterium]
AAITRLINRESLSREEMRFLFDRILRNEVTEMDQGAFLAALAAKGATAEEIAAVWEGIYELDTVKVQPDIDAELLENSGTGMDAVKTFNISTAAAVAAASDGIYLARHGSRAITSTCGTVDILEALGVDTEVDPECTKESIERCGIGIFNGMSSLVHPLALGRILSNLSFGTILNTAASLANPASPTLGVRGVYSPDMVRPVAEVMKEIGYRRCFVVHGLKDNGEPGIDEASTMGKTVYAELKEDGSIIEDSFYPEDLGFSRSRPIDISSFGDKEKEAKRLAALLQGRRKGKDLDILCLNTALLLYIGGKAADLQAGTEKAINLFAEGKPWEKLVQWATIQNRDKVKSMNRLKYLTERACV